MPLSYIEAGESVEELLIDGLRDVSLADSSLDCLLVIAASSGNNVHHL